MQRRLTIPVETVNRELDAKLLLACFAAERGFSVVLGLKREIHDRLATLPRSVYLGMNVTAKYGDIYRRLRELGYVPTATDEEGLVYFSTEHYYKLKVGPETLPMPEALFAWGEENARTWREHPAYRGAPIHATGNPRIDLLRPELRDYWSDQVRTLRERYGRFVLVNTNFGQLNNIRANRSAERRALEEAARDPILAKSFDVGLAAHRLKLFEHFQEAVGALARTRPEVGLVIRPHPSEDDRVWYRAASGCSNAHVIHRGNATPWLLAADAVVHNGCTTGLEAYVLDRPAIAFQPVADERFDKHLPNGLSHRAYALGELLELVDAELDGAVPVDPSAARAQRELLEHWVASTTGSFAAERMVDVLWRLAPRLEESGREPGSSTRVAQRARELARRWKRRSTRIFDPEKFRVRKEYYARIFPTPSVAELEAKVSRFRERIGRFEGIRIRLLVENVFEITSG